jgi:hypothetical protein
MTTIFTTAPIAMEQLKEYFTNRETTYIIDAKESTLKGQTLLTYLSNLDIPCDITNIDEELLLAYLKSPFMVSVKSLELTAIMLMMTTAGLNNGQQPIETGGWLSDFVAEHDEIIEQWINKAFCLPLYNFSTINDDRIDDFLASVNVDESTDMTGVNVISLLKHEEFYILFSMIPPDFKPTYFKHWFNQPVFRGKQLFAYWATSNNPLFLLTNSIASGELTSDMLKSTYE